jgi:hypothetical protein
MDRASAISTVLCISLVSLSASAPAAPVLDQHQELAGGTRPAFWDSVLLAQTFTAGQSGVLDHLELGLDGSNPATVQIRDTVSGQPGTTLLGSVDMPSGFVNGWNDIDFLSQGVAMSAGTTYAIVLLNSVPSSVDFVNANWDPTSYAGGDMWWNDHDAGWEQNFGFLGTLYGEGDMQFRTYVDTDPPASSVPAPSALILAGIGATAVRWLRRCRFM